MTVVFSTYHSIDVIAQAQHYGFPEFDLAICDEAHRTTGQTWEGDDESTFVRIHNNEIIKAKKRLYMTATPRIYSENQMPKKVKKEQKILNLSFNLGETELLAQRLKEVARYSMDDERIYGKNWHVLSFSDAVWQELLVPYKVIVFAISEQDVGQRLQKQLNDGNNNLKVGDATRIVGCYKALAKAGNDWGADRKVMQKAVAFCQVIGENSKGQQVNPGKKIAARQIAEYFNLVTAAYQENPRPDEPIGIEFEARYIHGGMRDHDKNERLTWLKANTENNHCRVLTNVRCLSEGVDVPALDAVIFLSPRQSQVDIVQSVGRVMRKAPGKKRGYIILPVVIPWGMQPHEAMKDNKPWKLIWETLYALKAHDDDGLGRAIDRAELTGQTPEFLEIHIDPATEKRAQKSQHTQLAALRQSHHLGNDQSATPPEQGKLFAVSSLEQAIMAKVVKKMADPNYWDKWTGRIERIAQIHIDRITGIIHNTENHLAQQAFNAFKAQLHQQINTSITDAEIIEMLAQHLITGPVFDSLFGSAQFTQHNPISAALQTVTDVLLQNFHLDKEQQELHGFYRQIAKQTENITGDARQKLIIQLYDSFFANAFKRVTQKHGIVYTPIEIVDFILHSVAYLLKTQFNKTFGDNEVQVLDPFTGTGTFISRLLTSGLIEADKLPHVYQHQLHATEILLLPYYIAAVNIESTFQQCCPDQAYMPFPGILLADTFNIPTKKSDHWVENQEQDVLAANSKRRKQQMESAITVIIGNPPYSVGQKNANDNNQNVSYTELDNRIKATYAFETKATNKNALYDSYIRAIRWASDRINKETGGIIGFVTNAGWLDSSATDGLRKCLAEDFSSLYIFHLRGNQRTQGEQSLKEGGKIFGSGSRAPIAISILVKNPQHSDQESGQIFFYDIGDYLSREQKLQKITELSSISGIETKELWQNLLPDSNHDWLNQRQDGFDQFLPIGDPKNKKKVGNKGVFTNYSSGIQTSRDAWCNNPSRKTLLKNIENLIGFYENQRKEFHQLYGELDLKQRLERANKFLNTDPTKISWSRSLKSDLARNYDLIFNLNGVAPMLYRPFSRSWLYYDRRLNEMVFQMPQIFPLPLKDNTVQDENYDRGQASLFEPVQVDLLRTVVKKSQYKNRLICVSGVGSRNFSVLMTDHIPSFDCIEKSQCFPLYLYNEKGEQKYGITDKTLVAFRQHYSQDSITKEQIFYYIYAVLHSTDYRNTWQANLLKELPRIPFARTVDDFFAFSDAGKQLGDVHCDFENASLYQEVLIDIHKTGCTCLKDLKADDFYVEKMKYGKILDQKTGKNAKDLSVIHYNKMITIRNIPAAAYNYVVNGRPAIDWVIDRQGVRTDKASGIVANSNDYALETANNPRYPLELLLRVMSVSLETLEIIKTLPPLES